MNASTFIRTLTIAVAVLLACAKQDYREGWRHTASAAARPGPAKEGRGTAESGYVLLGTIEYVAEQSRGFDRKATTEELKKRAGKLGADLVEVDAVDMAFGTFTRSGWKIDGTGGPNNPQYHNPGYTKTVRLDRVGATMWRHDPVAAAKLVDEKRRGDEAAAKQWEADAPKRKAEEEARLAEDKRRREAAAASLAAKSAADSESRTRALADYGSDPALVAALDKDPGASPEALLVLSVEKAAPETIRAMLDRGVDPNKGGGWTDGTTLMLAARRGDASIVKMLLDRGADPNLPKIAPAIEEALAPSKKEIFDMMVAKGADLKWPQLAAAAAGSGNVPLMERFLGMHKGDARKKMVENGTLASAKHGQRETFAWLVKNEKVEKHLPMALIYAARSGSVTGVEMVLAQGVDPNEYVDRGGYPLTEASEGKSPDVVRALLAGGAKPNFPSEARTPLMKAVSSIEVTRVLLDAGADVNTVRGLSWEKKGPQSALDCALREGTPELVELLRSRGAKRAAELK